jgi:uncharacterized repeat protein (TIGR02543 family)
MKNFLIGLGTVIVVAFLAVMGLNFAGVIDLQLPLQGEEQNKEQNKEQEPLQVQPKVTPPAVTTPAQEATPAAVKAPKFNITLFAGDATPSPAAFKVRYGKKITKLPTPERDGYEFVGWFTDRLYGEEVKNGDEMAFARDVEIYARWEKTSVGTDRSVRGVAVLMYHQFYDPAQGEVPKPRLKGNYMLASDFDDQVHYLSENDFYFPTWEEVYAFVKGEIDLPDNSVVITIDDGAKSFYKYAIPTLEKYRVPGTGFLIAKKVKAETVEKYASDMISLQSHTYDMHQGGSDGRGLFTTIDEELALEDIRKAADLLGTSDAVAYPYGHYNERTEAVLEEAGIHMGFTTSFGRVKPGMDPYALPRVRMNAGITLSSFVSQLNLK